jgi:hypothetical protein
MTIPSIILGSVIAVLVGAIFHLWRNGGFIQLVVYIVASVIGFWVGHGVAVIIDLDFLSYGPLRLGLALVGSVIFLGLAYWLTLTQEAY